MFVLFVIFGIIAGVLSSLGLGGGTILIPLLSLLSLSQKSAQVINITSFIVMAFFILIFNIKNKLVKVFPALVFSFFGVLSSLLFSFFVKDLNENSLKIYFGIFLIVVAIFEIIGFIVKYKSK